MFKIGDFSKIGQVSVRMLRHYDQLGLLKSAHIDHFTGYRYYTIEQLPRLNRILALKDLGLSLQQIKELLDNDLPAKQLRSMLTMKRAQLKQTIEAELGRLARVEARLERIEQEGQPSPYEVMIKSTEPVVVASRRALVPTVSEMGYYCRQMYTNLYQDLNTGGMAYTEPEITLYHNEAYTEQDIDIETSLPVDRKYLDRRGPDSPLQIRELPAHETVAALIYEGPYQDIGPAILALLIWIGMNQHTIAGPLRELHLSGPAHQNGQVVDSAVLEFQVPVKQQSPSPRSSFRGP